MILHKVITRIVLANGRKYSFAYNEYGELARVDLPTGGRIEGKGDRRIFRREGLHCTHFFHMPRRPRVVVPGVAHRVTQRGNNRQQVFFSA
ncbi:MAG: hypothetical protein ABFD86_23975, partial [Bryobacteraceae bacterium]